MEKKISLAGAVDIGGTKVSVGLVNSKGSVLLKNEFSTPVKEGPEQCIEVIASTLESQLFKEKMTFRDLSGIGIGCAGPVDTQLGLIQNPYTLPGWEGYPFTEILKVRTGKNVTIENDVNAALLGEVRLKNLSEKRVLMITFGTGIGVATFTKSALYAIENSYHPEMGHMQIDPTGPQCYCGNSGCFESLCSGKALHKRSQERGYSDFNHLFQAYEKGDQNALKFMRGVEEHLRTGCWNLMIVFKPEIIILGGGIMKRYFKFVSDSIYKGIPETLGLIDLYQLMNAEIDNDSALVGGAELIFRK
tara:strand:+ start:1121 stop:2032 length:912 start_codon:yes stop_codon:yes gene_type:complete